ncbi:hypothetical protein LINPERHAP1_LOCUS12236 [Linum perenne]
MSTMSPCQDFRPVQRFWMRVLTEDKQKKIVRTAPFSRLMKIRTALLIARLKTSMGMTQSKRLLAKYQSLPTIEEIRALRR